ncbi:peptidase S1, partial [Micromonospora azadirachtae]
MAVQTGLGEPRGPWFVSPELDPDGRSRRGGDGSGGDRGGRLWRGRMLAALA